MTNGGQGPGAGSADGLGEFIIGRNAVLELLKSGRDIDKIYVKKGGREGSVSLIIAQAAKRGIPVIDSDVKKLDKLSEGGVHQGVAASVPQAPYSDVADMLALAESRGESPLIVICDSVNDPHNLGAIIRTAECAGAHGVIIPKRRSAPLSGTVAKASAGALFHIPVARVANLSSEIRALKEKGLWVWAVEPSGASVYDNDFTSGCLLVLGSEGEGLSRLVRENCDFTASVPMYGSINSLNVSNAAAVVLFEAARQRRAKGK